MSTPNDGGSAWPQIKTAAGAYHGNTYSFGGMSLRDWFAGQALAGLTANTDLTDTNAKITAAVAYDCADAMLDARNKIP